ncbi:hypothetical protein [Elioraea sp.]|uniref:hypothetical protein n=1 Tax=Elioraea sp. TaxID=2185103 RepID=UPI0025BD5ECD|nr:hypothetical protein [Elioraea sp.]
MSDDRTSPLTIRRVRITGLAGPAPSAEQVRSAIGAAFAREQGEQQTRTQPPLRHDATLSDAASAVGRAARGRAR